MIDTNEILIEALLDDVLDPKTVQESVAEALRLIQGDDAGSKTGGALDREIGKLGQEPGPTRR